MKTIEERAESYVGGISNNVRAESKKLGYIKGATDQREIDLDEVCAWLEENLGSCVGEGGWNIWPSKDEESLTCPEIIAKHLREAMKGI